MLVLTEYFNRIFEHIKANYASLIINRMSLPLLTRSSAQGVCTREGLVLHIALSKLAGSHFSFS